ncbi:uncharacterized protein EV422DRAFT_567495 [Fimicolochytrium jonesii]|uniref:uncharacterized protein n=1 Tax=Fimicolochytrium jonesii TaxID=1396493 RepID=UPI0022FF0EB4|nr:uncharacterized protein EV422DRAFT_567495 [Fimicolochytrium jonesii]KAI8821158.1 hypothetical protein EV422DRAFT_567495 [Fimicolochytrium jonesii]
MSLTQGDVTPTAVEDDACIDIPLPTRPRGFEVWVEIPTTISAHGPYIPPARPAAPKVKREHVKRRPVGASNRKRPTIIVEEPPGLPLRRPRGRPKKDGITSPGSSRSGSGIRLNRSERSVVESPPPHFPLFDSATTRVAAEGEISAEFTTDVRTMPAAIRFIVFCYGFADYIKWTPLDVEFLEAELLKGDSLYIINVIIKLLQHVVKPTTVVTISNWQEVFRAQLYSLAKYHRDTGKVQWSADLPFPLLDLDRRLTLLIALCERVLHTTKRNVPSHLLRNASIMPVGIEHVQSQQKSYVYWHFPVGSFRERLYCQIFEHSEEMETFMPDVGVVDGRFAVDFGDGGGDANLATDERDEQDWSVAVDESGSIPAGDDVGQGNWNIPGEVQPTTSNMSLWNSSVHTTSAVHAGGSAAEILQSSTASAVAPDGNPVSQEANTPNAGIASNHWEASQESTTTQTQQQPHMRFYIVASDAESWTSFLKTALSSNVPAHQALRPAFLTTKYKTGFFEAAADETADDDTIDAPVAPPSPRRLLEAMQSEERNRLEMQSTEEQGWLQRRADARARKQKSRAAKKLALVAAREGGDGEDGDEGNEGGEGLGDTPYEPPAKRRRTSLLPGSLAESALSTQRSQADVAPQDGKRPTKRGRGRPRKSEGTAPRGRRRKNSSDMDDDEDSVLTAAERAEIEQRLLAKRAAGLDIRKRMAKGLLDLYKDVDTHCANLPPLDDAPFWSRLSNQLGPYLPIPNSPFDTRMWVRNVYGLQFDTRLTNQPTSSIIKNVCRHLVDNLKHYPAHDPFFEPIDPDDFPNYAKIVTKPMDIKTLYVKLILDEYADFNAFLTDLHLIFRNCRRYNEPHSRIVYQCLQLELSFIEVACMLGIVTGHVDSEVVLALKPDPFERFADYLEEDEREKVTAQEKARKKRGRPKKNVDVEVRVERDIGDVSGTSTPRNVQAQPDGGTGDPPQSSTSSLGMFGFTAQSEDINDNQIMSDHGIGQDISFGEPSSNSVDNGLDSNNEFGAIMPLPPAPETALHAYDHDHHHLDDHHDERGAESGPSAAVLYAAASTLALASIYGQAPAAVVQNSAGSSTEMYASMYTQRTIASQRNQGHENEDGNGDDEGSPFSFARPGKEVSDHYASTAATSPRATSADSQRSQVTSDSSDVYGGVYGGLWGQTQAPAEVQAQAQAQVHTLMQIQQTRPPSATRVQAPVASYNEQRTSYPSQQQQPRTQGQLTSSSVTDVSVGSAYGAQMQQQQHPSAADASTIGLDSRRSSSYASQHQSSSYSAPSIVTSASYIPALHPNLNRSYAQPQQPYPSLSTVSSAASVPSVQPDANRSSATQQYPSERSSAKDEASIAAAAAAVKANHMTLEELLGDNDDPYTYGSEPTALDTLAATATMGLGTSTVVYGQQQRMNEWTTVEAGRVSQTAQSQPQQQQGLATGYGGQVETRQRTAPAVPQPQQHSEYGQTASESRQGLQSSLRVPQQQAPSTLPQAQSQHHMPYQQQPHQQEEHQKLPEPASQQLRIEELLGNRQSPRQHRSLQLPQMQAQNTANPNDARHEPAWAGTNSSSSSVDGQGTTSASVQQARQYGDAAAAPSTAWQQHNYQQQQSYGQSNPPALRSASTESLNKQRQQQHAHTYNAHTQASSSPARKTTQSNESALSVSNLLYGGDSTTSFKGSTGTHAAGAAPAAPRLPPKTNTSQHIQQALPTMQSQTSSVSVSASAWNSVYLSETQQQSLPAPIQPPLNRNIFYPSQTQLQQQHSSPATMQPSLTHGTGRLYGGGEGNATSGGARTSSGSTHYTGQQHHTQTQPQPQTQTQSVASTSARPVQYSSQVHHQQQQQQPPRYEDGQQSQLYTQSQPQQQSSYAFEWPPRNPQPSRVPAPAQQSQQQPQYRSEHTDQRQTQQYQPLSAASSSSSASAPTLQNDWSTSSTTHINIRTTRPLNSSSNQSQAADPRYRDASQQQQQQVFGNQSQNANASSNAYPAAYGASGYRL